jgi:hypothetical protein
VPLEARAEDEGFGRSARRCTTIFFHLLPSATLNAMTGSKAEHRAALIAACLFFMVCSAGMLVFNKLVLRRIHGIPITVSERASSASAGSRTAQHCSARMYVYALSRPELSAYFLPSYRTRRSS